jgi:hypothetical protein
MTGMEMAKRSPTSSSHLSQKDHQLHVENAVYNPDTDISMVNEKKLIAKIDLALIPWLSFLYLLSFLDRTSIGNAKVLFHGIVLLAVCLNHSWQLYNMEKDLHITDTQYLMTLTIFFFSYAVFEVCVYSGCLSVSYQPSRRPPMFFSNASDRPFG